jgi:colanic acid/amylovoran biosynthesis glycosyltransferase
MTTAAIEALAMGIPCLTTDHSGFPEQIENGVNGYMVPEGDYQALGEKLVYMMQHPELWPAMSRAARKAMEEKYDAKVLIAKQIEIYQNLLR